MVVNSTRWLTSDAARVVATEFRDRPVQMLTLGADVPSLIATIPISPETTLAGEGPPSPAHRWFGVVDHRPFEIQADAISTPTASAVAVYTPFLTSQDDAGDWTVLLDLQSLPPAIHASRPLYIESRTQDPAFVVYRPEKQGWETCLYEAASHDDACKLLEFLLNDPWNATCHIGPPPPKGTWATIQNGEPLLGYGSDLNAALLFACEFSVRKPSMQYLVKDLSGQSNLVYEVLNGIARKLDESGR
jgi:hypothetical protein